MSKEIRALLDSITPSFAGEAGDWQRVLSDAAPIASPRRRSPWLRRPLALALAAAVLVLCPIAIAVSSQHNWWLGDHGPRQDSPVGVALATIWNGQRWTLLAYVNDRQGICYGVSGPTAEQGSSLTCDRINGVPRPPGSSAFTPHDLTYSAAAGPARLGPSWIAGMGVGKITRVAVRLSDGTILRTTAAPAPAEIHRNVRFFLIRAPRGLSLSHTSEPATGPRLLRVAGYAGNRLVACVDVQHFKLRAPLAACAF